MYNPESISVLTKRIRWNESLDPDFPIMLSHDNNIGLSGKNFQSFHQLVSIDNIYDAVPAIEMDADPFNELLSDIREQAVYHSVTEIMDKNNLYLPATDYSNMIIQNVQLFDDAIGYKVIMIVLEMFMSTKRSNLVERNSKFAISNLKLELEGFRNENGHVVAQGIRYHYDKVVKDATNKLFPQPIIVTSQQIW